jgi:hypothetical protein
MGARYYVWAGQAATTEFPAPTPETRAYSDRRKTDGLSHREIVRCLKRYIARRLYPILIKDLAALT